MRYIKIKNTDTVIHEWGGKIFQPAEEFEITTKAELTVFQKCEIFFDELDHADISNSSGVISNSIDAWKWIQGDESLVDVNSSPAFKSKILPDGRKVYRRKHGFSISIGANSNTEAVLTVPYTLVKINEMELINCSIDDTVDFKVYDTVDGLYQQSLGVPAGSVDTDLLLNQFGFDVCVPEGMYRDKSDYDAELIGGMRIKINYNNNTDAAVTIRGNIVYHEIKSS